MKKRLFLFGLILIGLLGAPTVSYAQKAKVAKKAVETFSKNKKNISKATKNISPKAKEKPSKVAKKAEEKIPKSEKKTAQPVSVSCSACNGNGYVSEWNTYSKRYIKNKCDKCNGTGKVRRVIRH